MQDEQDDAPDFEEMMQVLDQAAATLRHDKSPASKVIRDTLLPTLAQLLSIVAGHDDELAKLVGDEDDEDDDGEEEETDALDAVKRIATLAEEMLLEQGRSTTDVQRLSEMRQLAVSIVEAAAEADKEEDE